MADRMKVQLRMCVCRWQNRRNEKEPVQNIERDAERQK